MMFHRSRTENPEEISKGKMKVKGTDIAGKRDRQDQFSIFPAGFARKKTAWRLALAFDKKSLSLV